MFCDDVVGCGKELKKMKAGAEAIAVIRRLKKEIRSSDITSKPQHGPSWTVWRRRTSPPPGG